MPSYEALDSIADAYNPLLASVWLGLVIAPLIARSWRVAFMRLALGLLALVVCYALMYLDKAAAIWPAVGLDYSTHTAVALAFVAVHCVLLRRLWPLWIGSFAAYAALMLYQRYHSWLDIITTAAVVAPLVIALCVLYTRKIASPRGEGSPSR